MQRYAGLITDLYLYNSSEGQPFTNGEHLVAAVDDGPLAGLHFPVVH